MAGSLASATRITILMLKYTLISLEAKSIASSGTSGAENSTGKHGIATIAFMIATMDRKELQKSILINSFTAGACHLGSAFSCVDILIEFFDNILKDEDVFIFSKASGVSALYCVLADKGYFSKEKIAEYLKNYPLPSVEVPGVIHSLGSLGHGLPLAVGTALADRNRNVYILMSDGECQEGTTYESALFARQHNLKNLFVIIDANQYQALGKTNDILNLDTAFEFLKNTLPNCEIRKTIKGGNIDFLQGTKGHYKNLTQELLEQALCQI